MFTTIYNKLFKERDSLTLVKLPYCEPFPAFLPAKMPEAKLTSGIVLGHSKGQVVSWVPSVRNNPNMAIIGLSGMGKTTTLKNIMRQAQGLGINVCALAYHPDLADVLKKPQVLGVKGAMGALVQCADFRDSCAMVRDALKHTYQSFGDLQLAQLFKAIKGLRDGSNLRPLSDLSVLLEAQGADPKIRFRIDELNDYEIFEGQPTELLNKNTIIELYSCTNEVVKKAALYFYLLRIYLEAKASGVQRDIKTIVVVDEAHLVARAPILKSFTRECRKFGVAIVLASQSILDFDKELLPGMGNYIAFKCDSRDTMVLGPKLYNGFDIPSMMNLTQLIEHHAIVKLGSEVARSCKMIEEEKQLTLGDDVYLTGAAAQEMLGLKKTAFYAAIRFKQIRTVIKSINGRIKTLYHKGDLERFVLNG